jgi:hypothetical protein
MEYYAFTMAGSNAVLLSEQTREQREKCQGPREDGREGLMEKFNHSPNPYPSLNPLTQTTVRNLSEVVARRYA